MYASQDYIIIIVKCLEFLMEAHPVLREVRTESLYIYMYLT